MKVCCINSNDKCFAPNGYFEFEILQFTQFDVVFLILSHFSISFVKMHPIALYNVPFNIISRASLRPFTIKKKFSVSS